ncbi:MAG TPA: S1 RNA-binding domain-containing protein, partial [Acinetobacter sp.]|nr:S1 RNA-binding domain-containing protein [Acinetobacter sp.]
LANEFVADPHKVVKPGQIVQVRVLQVDAERKRVNLSMRAEGAAPAKAARPPQRPAQERVERTERKPSQGQRPPRKEGEVKRLQQNKPKSEKPQEQKIGGLGALLLQAGVKGSK